MTTKTSSLVLAIFGTLLLSCGSDGLTLPSEFRTIPVRKDTSSKDTPEDIPAWATSLFSAKGQDMLYASSGSVVRTNAMRILGNLETQQTQSWCGVASAVTALNSLPIERMYAPIEPFYYPYKLFTQVTFFSNECVQKTAGPTVVSAAGTTVDQLSQMIQCYSPDSDSIQLSTPIHAKDEYSNVHEMRKALVSSLERSNERVLINYQRREFRPHGGHWSLLAAYNKDEDAFLIADVESYLYPPVWLTAEEIFNSVTTIDGMSKKSRGFVIIQGAIVN